MTQQQIDALVEKAWTQFLNKGEFSRWEQESAFKEALQSFAQEVQTETSSVADCPPISPTQSPSGVPSFTPGPWHVQSVGDSDGEVAGIDYCVCAGEEATVEELACLPDWQTACLIAAAPELYQFAKLMDDVFDYGVDAVRNDQWDDIYIQLRAALAKAHGLSASEQSDDLITATEPCSPTSETVSARITTDDEDGK